MKTEFAALAARIREALFDLERVVKRAELLIRKAQQSQDDGYMDGVALNLHGFYAGVEHIFKDIARNLDRTLPEGPDWHQDLLLQMASEISSLRPPVIASETRYGLDEYRGFRHVVRNVYTFNINPARLMQLTQSLQECYRTLSHDLNQFCEFLDELSRVDDVGYES